MSQKVRASHILVKHAKVAKPSSWRQANITISEEEAIAKAQKIRDKIIKKEFEFGELAEMESDCNSAKRGGDLGWFQQGKMHKEFEEATFALKVGELSPPVKSSSGIHIILRTG